MVPRKHVVITGTGRCGTTFLVELLTNMGLETGFKAEDLVQEKDKVSRAGLEYDILSKDCPFIIKSPGFCDVAKEVMSREDIIIEHIFIPIRDLNAAAESRRSVERINISNLTFLDRLKHLINPKGFTGGLWHTHSVGVGKQEEILLGKIYKLLLAVSDTSLPVTFIQYPRSVKDCPYLFEKLHPILGDIKYEFFQEVFAKTVCPEIVHNYNENDR